LIDHLIFQGVTHFVFALGYKSNEFILFLEEKLPNKNYSLVIEDTPLGTGGAIILAASKTTSNDVIALNGDSLFKANLIELMQFHLDNKSSCTLALKPMQHFERYGSVELKDDATITSFKEKKMIAAGLINGGVYAINIPNFLEKNLPTQFSIEKEFLEKYTHEGKFYGFVQDAYFIDIGIPEDYTRAQKELL
jgi:D-glycero-alpha-D-manno-heptose 1-phosphate guanylyltransferase